MKIGPAGAIRPLDQGATPSKPTPPSSGFGQLFRETLHRQAEGLQEPFPVLQPAAAMPCAPKPVDASDTLPGTRVMEDFIDALEGYQQLLGDSSNSLRDIAPSLARLERAHRHLAEVASESSVDPSLGGIMNQALVTAAMEIQRFRSGAYC